MFMITENGYNKLKEELKFLMEVERPRTLELLENSRVLGDAEIDDSEYLFAKEEQDRIENRIDYVSNLLNESEIFTPKSSYSEVEFGATITLIDCDTNNKMKYTIVSSFESNPSQGLISIEAPIVKELIGCKIGDFAYFNDKEYELLEIQ